MSLTASTMVDKNVVEFVPQRGYKSWISFASVADKAKCTVVSSIAEVVRESVKM